MSYWLERVSFLQQLQPDLFLMEWVNSFTTSEITLIVAKFLIYLIFLEKWITRLLKNWPHSHQIWEKKMNNT